MTRRPPLTPGDPRHGTQNGYTNHGCRCDPCKAANRAYRLDRYGNRTINASETANHVRQLIAAGATSAGIARIAGCSPSTIDNLRHGKTINVMADTATAVLAVTIEQARPEPDPTPDQPTPRPRRKIGLVHPEEWTQTPGKPCDGNTTAWFSTTEEGQQHAADLCKATCPVLEECDRYAEQIRIDHGVWGGLTESQRRRVRRRRMRAEAAARRGAA